METRLQLLASDGAIVVCFHAELTADQYESLIEAAELWPGRDDLVAAAKQLAADWGIEAEVD